MRQVYLFIGLLAAAAIGMGCEKAAAARPASGQELFAYCAACHGQSGEGNEKLRAPAIAGLPSWYVKSQVQKFRWGHRGAHAKDVEGLRMRPMSQTLSSDAQIDAVAAWVSQLPIAKAAPTVQGDAKAGAGSFATCVACHGPDGKGNEALKAPPLVTTNDWYQVAQLQKFRAGIRGAAAGDASGATMRPMAMTLADDQAVLNVVAHINSLRQ